MIGVDSHTRKEYVEQAGHHQRVSLAQIQQIKNSFYPRIKYNAKENLAVSALMKRCLGIENITSLGCISRFAFIPLTTQYFLLL